MKYYYSIQFKNKYNNLKYKYFRYKYTTIITQIILDYTYKILQVMLVISIQLILNTSLLTRINKTYKHTCINKYNNIVFKQTNIQTHTNTKSKNTWILTYKIFINLYIVIQNYFNTETQLHIKFVYLYLCIFTFCFTVFSKTKILCTSKL